jgi:uncharacterized repeat protein (TIGR03803 family)
MFAVALFVTSAWAATEKKLHDFSQYYNGAPDGAWPEASLIFDAAGNLYGTTSLGGTLNNGTVFELTATEGGGWTEKVLHNFNGEDGYTLSASLIFDAAGNLYGIAQMTVNSYGTVFELMPAEGGRWTVKVLHYFNWGRGGILPKAGLIFDAAGNLYGTTAWGGHYGSCGDPGCGTVFEMTPKEGGGWTEKTLHDFGTGVDGALPVAGLIFDASGNLYGTTSQGGDYYNSGTVFELTPKEGGGWTEKKLHNFGIDGRDAATPNAGLIFDAAGNLYGTTASGGDYDAGTVFELTPKEGGGWTEKKLHNFGIGGRDGTTPNAGLMFDAAGNLYGTTYGGGDYGGGTVFELTPDGHGAWTEKKLHNFGIDGRDGINPYAGLIFDASGNLYGTTKNGGDYGVGTVFEITP